MKKITLLLLLSLILFSCKKKEKAGCGDKVALNYSSNSDFIDNDLCVYNCSCGYVVGEELVINPNWPGPVLDPYYLEFYLGYNLTIKNSCSGNTKTFTSLELPQISPSFYDVGDYFCFTDSIFLIHPLPDSFNTSW